MKKIFMLLALVIAFMTIYTLPIFAEETYADMLMKEKYYKALKYGCPDAIVKKPSTAGTLGILPGGGAFYTREVGWGILDLLTWPFSIIWDPAASVDRAKKINMRETVFRCEIDKDIKL